MGFVDIFSYYTALVAIAIAPGPLMVLLMTRAASNDLRRCWLCIWHSAWKPDDFISCLLWNERLVVGIARCIEL